MNHTITLTAEQEACLQTKCDRDNANVIAGHNAVVKAAEGAPVRDPATVITITPPELITIGSMLAIKIDQYLVDCERDNGTDLESRVNKMLAGKTDAEKEAMLA